MPRIPTPGDAHRPHLKLLFRRDTLASIPDFHANMTVRGNNPNRGRRAFRMTMNVGKTLLYGPENRCLCLARKTLEILRELQIHLNLANVRESIDYQRRAEASPASSSRGGWSRWEIVRTS